MSAAPRGADRPGSRPGSRPGPTLGSMLALMLGLLLAAGCDGSSPSPPPNVLVITIDTVRADRLGCYGYDRHATTPRLDALARQSVLFERAFANSSFTPPAHASILTSLYPGEHGLLHWSLHLAAVPTAAEAFRAAGWRTAAFTPLPTLLKLGLERGFETAVSPPFRTEGGRTILADADAINAAALPVLTAADPRPFFAWVHYYDAHRPYGRQGPEWSGRFTDHDDPAVGATEDWYQLTPEKRSKLGITPEQAALMADHYDGGLAFLDAGLGRLLDGLSAAGVLENTVLVVVADHGEVFDEHEAEWFSHDPWLVDENVHVPLLLRLPGAAHAGLRVPDLVSQVDVLPTLLELSAVPAPGPLSGLSLVPLLDGGRLARGVVLAERQGPDLTGATAGDAAARASRDRQYMLRTGTRKLVIYADRQEHGERGWYAVDGPQPETTDLAAAEPDQVKSAWGACRDWLGSLRRPKSEPGAATSPPLSPEDLDIMESLGYVGGDRP